MKQAITILLILLFFGSVFAVPIAASARPVAAEKSPVQAKVLQAHDAIAVSAKEAVSESKDEWIKGDINHDGVVNFGDINPFTHVIEHPWFYKIFHPHKYKAADINNDGIVNQADVKPFVALLSQ